VRWRDTRIASPITALNTARIQDFTVHPLLPCSIRSETRRCAILHRVFYVSPYGCILAALLCYVSIVVVVVDVLLPFVLLLAKKARPIDNVRFHMHTYIHQYREIILTGILMSYI
jgi:hypothetical protein